MKREKEQKKRHPLKTAIIVVLCVALSLGALYQGYRLARDFLLEKVFVYFLESEEQEKQPQSEESDGQQMSIQDVADAIERLNGVEQDKQDDTSKKDKKPASNKQIAKDIVEQIPEADKNRAIAIVSSVASVDDCLALYELAINGDKKAKEQLKAIYARFTQAQTDELWALYEKNKHLLE